jgi:acetylornithine deacetylase/succinyl-diaminopimelate desuccinylase-like protein
VSSSLARESAYEEAALRCCAFLDARENELLDFACRLIATPSVNPPGDERAAANLVAEQLATLGITDVKQVAARETRPNVIAGLGNAEEGPTLILSGHLDTKPAGDENSWLTNPLTPVIRAGRLIGLGSGDMKAAVAAMVYSAASLRSDPDFRGKLSLVFTADEEAGSVYGSRWLAESGLLQADAAVIGEPSGITQEWEALHIVSRGAALFKVRVSGTQVHSSISDRIPTVNATVMMARLIDRMHSKLKGQLTYAGHPLGGLGPTVNVGVMAKAGVYYGVYPGSAEFACDIRTLPGMNRDQMEQDLQEFLKRAMEAEPELRAELVFETWVPATEISPEEPVVRSLQSAAHTVLGHTPRLEAFPGATDAAPFQLVAGIPTVAAFGPGLLPYAHSPNESLAVASVLQAAKIYALAAWRYLHQYS